jgi:hypothetical protein
MLTIGCTCMEQNSSCNDNSSSVQEVLRLLLNFKLIATSVVTASSLILPPKCVSALSWWWGLLDSVTWRAMPAVV